MLQWFAEYNNENGDRNLIHMIAVLNYEGLHKDKDILP